jgi:hypothetical protein
MNAEEKQIALKQILDKVFSINNLPYFPSIIYLIFNQKFT